MTDERIGDLTHQEIEKIIRAALRLGEAAAQRRSVRLANSQQRSMEHLEQMRRTLGEERDLAQKIYRRALDSRFWDDPMTRVEDVEAVVTAAKQFAPMDPEAALAARECEQRANQREPASAVSDGLVERATHVEQEEHIEAVNAAHREVTSTAKTEEDTASAALWDSTTARAQWIAAKDVQGADMHALQGALLADVSLHQPARKSLKVQKRRSATQASSYRANKMRQKVHTL